VYETDWNEIINAVTKIDWNSSKHEFVMLRSCVRLSRNSTGTEQYTIHPARGKEDKMGRSLAAGKFDYVKITFYLRHLLSLRAKIRPAVGSVGNHTVDTLLYYYRLFYNA